MMPLSARGRGAAARWLVLTLSLTVIGVVIAALACAPSAPGTEDGSEGATSTPTPTPTPDHQADLSELVKAVMVKHATVAAPSGGVVGQAASQMPPTMYVNVYTDQPQSAAVKSFLAEHNVTPTDERGCGERCIYYHAVVPVSLLQSLSTVPGVLAIDSIVKYYEKLDVHLNPIVAQHDAGLITAQEEVEQSALPHWGEKVLVVADFSDSAHAHKAIRYLKGKDVYMMPHPAEVVTIAGFVPVSLLLPLSQQPGAVLVTGYGYGADLDDAGVQEELNQYKPPQPASDGSGGYLHGHRSFLRLAGPVRPLWRFSWNCVHDAKPKPR